MKTTTVGVELAKNCFQLADAAALIEASRCEEIKPVAVKCVEQQVLQQLHRLRTQWQGGRRARINSLRGMLREFGIDIPVGAVRGVAAIRETPSRPILLRVEDQAGHGIGSTRQQRLAETADIYSFLWWQMGARSTKFVFSYARKARTRAT